jgi:spore coat polysaccharide biosynthesis protein SpsF
MKTGALVLARMKSSRCPGKALRDLAGRPLIDRVVDRARCIRSADEVVVATTGEKADDRLAEHCRKLGVGVYRGSANNVAKRVLDCVETRGLGHFVRINADSPLLDPWLIEVGIERLANEALDLVTNVDPRSYPHGVAVEAFRTNAFRRAYRWMTHPDEFEHISRYFYRHRAQFRIGYLPPADADYSDIRLTVDTEDDLRRAAALIEHLGPAYETSSWREVIAAYRACWARDDQHPAAAARA